MAEHAFTPGPWRLVINGTMTGRWIEIVGRENYYSDGAPYVVAQTDSFEVEHRGTTWEREPDADEIEANARLIAAAPDLLEVLKRIVLNNCEEDDTHEDYLVYNCLECDASAHDDHTLIVHDGDCLLGEAQAIIAKATEATPAVEAGE